MFNKIKAALGLALLAALAMSATSVMSASALTSGHFTSEAANTKLDITVATGTSHLVYFHDFGTTVDCHHQTFTAHNIQSTTQQITITPALANCTTSGNTAAVGPHWNGCHFAFTSRTAPGHGTSHFVCPAGVSATFTQGATCTETFSAQTPEGGVTYDTILIEGKHAITANITITGFSTTRHGQCQLFGTNGKAQWTGSLTIQGTNAETGAPVGITAT
jgi:hypothetical protein